MCIFHAPHGRGGRFAFFFLWLREAACFARPSCFQCLQVAVSRPGSILSMGSLPVSSLPPTVAVSVARRPSLLLSARLGCLPDAIAPHRAAVSSPASGLQASHGKPSFAPPSLFFLGSWWPWAAVAAYELLHLPCVWCLRSLPLPSRTSFFPASVNTHFTLQS